MAPRERTKPADGMPVATGARRNRIVESGRKGRWRDLAGLAAAPLIYKQDRLNPLKAREVIMDAALTLLFNALVAGAAAALKPTAEKVVTDGYAGLKALIRRKWAGKVALDELDRAPAEADVQSALKRDLEAAGTGADAEVLQQAQALLKAVEAHDAGAATEAGISITDLKSGAEIDIEDLVAEGNVRLSHFEANGSIRIKGVHSGNPPRR
jgi:hypothetical protein